VSSLLEWHGGMERGRRDAMPSADSLEADVLGHAGVTGRVTAGDGGFHPVTEMVRPQRAYPGNPQGGRAAQVVGRSTVRAAIPFRIGREVPQGGSAATVTATRTALEAVTPSAGTESGSARIVVVRAVPGERFDGPAEPVTGRAPDHGAFDGPVS